MKRSDIIFNKVQESLTLLSDKVKNCVVEIYPDEEEEGVVIILAEGTNKAQFCSLLHASGLFHQNDTVSIKVK